MAIFVLIAIAIGAGFNRALDILPARLFRGMADQGHLTTLGYAFAAVCVAIGVATLGFVWSVSSKVLDLPRREA